MKTFAFALGACAIMLFAAAPARADWDHPVKWDQLQPDEELWGMTSYIADSTNILIADDFPCTETGWITDIEFNGWAVVGAVGISSFRITFWSDVPATPNEESHPGEEPLRTIEVGEVDPGDPLGPGWQKIDEYLYKINIPEDSWFLQEKDRIYWIGIQAVMGGSGSFNWIFRDRKADTSGDDAVFSSTGAAPWKHWGWPDADPSVPPEYYEGTLPAEWYKSADMSFRLTGIPVPEPGMLALAGLGLLALVRRRR